MKQTKQFKRLWSLMLLLIAMLLPQGVWATINPTQPEGSGTQSDPYLISNRAELYWFATKVNGGDDNCSAKLTSDIIFNDGTFDADGTWSKAGEPESWAPLSIFNGTFDGNGHTISGLYYCNAQTNNVGFCGMLFGNIKHLGIINSYLKGNLWCGIICGNIIDGGTISDCYTCGSTVIGDYWVGCLCGRIEGGSTISNCYTTSKASGVDDVGNVCGQNNSSTLTNCYTNQEVSNGIGTHKDDSEFKSGEVTYLLTGGKNDGNQVWFQTLGEDGDAFPTFVSNGNNTVQKSDDGTSYINVVTHVHSLFKVEAEPATESAHGHNEYWACSGCDVIFTDETGTVPTNLEEMIIHSVAYENGIGTCNVCHACQYEEPTADIDGYYLIGNAGQLIAFANWVNNGQEANNAKLTANIILNDGTFADDGTFKATGASASSTPIEWPVIGRYDMYPHGYAGTFDGQGHTISGLYANYVNSGLVGLSAGECKIKNVGVINSYFDGGMVGAICGNGTVEISNCYSINVICKGSFVGGIIGQSNSNSTRVKNCYSTASLINTRGYDYQTGGIVGQMPGSTINCYTNYKSVSGWCNSETHCEASVSADRFASGEIAYKLNGSTSDGTQAWYQTIGTDAAPVLVSNGSNTVYEVDLLTCSGENAGKTFANANEAVTQPHDYQVLLDENSNPVFVWSEEYTSATLQVVCSHNAEHTANVEVTGEGITSAVTTPATCTAGVRTYTAKATYKGETYTGTKEVEIAALGHNFVNGVCEYCSVTQLTYISGSGGFGGEGSEKLIDGNDATKWCSDWSVDNKPYIIFKTAAPASISGYSMVHGNDTPKEDGRAWKAWTIYGANFDSDEEATAASEAWQEVDSRSGYNYGSDYSFSNLTCESYQYYKIVIDSNVSGDKQQQMAEIHFTLSCAHSGDKIEHSASEATAEYHGNGGYKVCAQCGACLDAEGNVIARPVIHYFDDEHTHARIEPTCTAVGSIAYKECVVCNKFFDMDNNPVSSTVIDMIEHTFDSDGKCTKCQYVCEHSEYSSFDSDTHRCTICQQSESHIFDETGVCEVCGGYQKPEGEGTEQSPYLIANKGNILWFNNSFNDTHLKLVADVAITKDITVGSGKTLTMNLDGHALTGEGIDIFSVTGGTLNLRDAESNDGKLTKGDHGVMITEGGIFNMYGGSITECTSANAGAAVNVTNGTFNMYGGAITGNKVGTILNNRGVVYVHPNNGYFNMQGGSITNNSGKTYGVGSGYSILG